MNKKYLKNIIFGLSVFIFISCKSSCKQNQESELEIAELLSAPLEIKDRQGNLFIPEIKKDVEKCQYKKELFRAHNGKMHYIGDENYTYRQGVDISRHDGRVNWKKVKNSGRDFVFLRIGWRGYQTGILHVDEHFHRNIKGAIKAGLDIGVYIFSQAINEEEAREEAELVINELKPYEIQLPVVYDPESISWEEARTDDVPGSQFTKNTLLFCKLIKEAGYEPMIYSNLNWEVNFFDLSQLKEYKIWYADYRPIPMTPYHFEFWQYGGESVKVPGIRKKCDVDIQLIKKEEFLF